MRRAGGRKVHVEGVGEISCWPNHAVSKSLTSMEREMALWIQNGRGRVVRIALRALIKISEGNLESQEYLQSMESIAKNASGVEDETSWWSSLYWKFIRGESKQAHANRIAREEEAAEKRLRARLSRDHLFAFALRYMVVVLATCWSPGDIRVVLALFSELHGQWRSYITDMRKPRARLARIFGRYESCGEHAEDMTRLVNHLVRAIRLYRYRWPLLIVGGLLLASLGIEIYRRFWA